MPLLTNSMYVFTQFDLKCRHGVAADSRQRVPATPAADGVRADRANAARACPAIAVPARFHAAHARHPLCWGHPEGKPPMLHSAECKLGMLCGCMRAATGELAQL